MTIGLNLSFKLPLFFILIGVGTAVYYDVVNHGSFQKSVTGKWMKDSGLLGIYQTINKEMSTKLPVFTASVYKLMNADKLKEGIVSGYRHLAKLLEPVSAWVYKNFPLRLEYTNEVVIPMIVNSVSKFTSGVGSYLAVGQENFKDLSINLGAWINENLNLDGVSFQKIQGTFADGVHRIQSTMIDAFNWAHQQLVGY